MVLLLTVVVDVKVGTRPSTESVVMGREGLTLNGLPLYR